jgi:hypothetical protein
MDTELKNLIGKKVLEIWANTEFMKFVTNEGDYIYRVVGDCCSRSSFYDFYGIENLLNRVVKDVAEVKLLTSDVMASRGNEIKVYGYKISTHLADDETYGWGGETACFSFRNESNGYYGGDILQVQPKEKDKYGYISSDCIPPTDEDKLIQIKYNISEIK